MTPLLPSAHARHGSEIAPPQHLSHTHPPFAPHLDALRSLSAALRKKHGKLWFHGNDAPGTAFQQDPEHPGVWWSDRLTPALWYAQHPQQDGTLHLAALPRDLPRLSDPEVLRALCREAGLVQRDVQRWHRSGKLYLHGQEAVCASARQLQMPGLVMRDHTLIPHRSAVLWTAPFRPVARVQLPQTGGEMRVTILPEQV